MSDPAFLDAVQAFLQDLRKDMVIIKGYVSPRTQGEYEHRLTELGRYVASHQRLLAGKASPEDLTQALAGLKLSAITESVLKDYLIDHLEAKNSPSTLNTHLYTLKSFWQFAAKQYSIPDLTLDLAHSRAPRRHGVHLPERHVQAFLEHLAKREGPKAEMLRDRLFFEISARYGTRISEALGLDLDSLTLTPHSIDIRVFGKGGKARVVPLPLYDEKGPLANHQAFGALVREYLDTVRKAWKSHAGHEKALFLSRKGMRWSDDAAREVFHRAMVDLGFKQHGYVVHSLRHALASHLLNQGVGLPTVSKILGHASTQVTASIYAHSDTSEVEKGMTKGY